MTELDEARAHLRRCQSALASARKISHEKEFFRQFEVNVLAALSWIWDVQERELDARDREWAERVS